jgi:Rad51
MSTNASLCTHINVYNSAGIFSGTFYVSYDQVKLIIIDSIAFHFRHDFDDYMLRSRILNNIAQSLNKLAAVHKLAVRFLSACLLCK